MAALHQLDGLAIVCSPGQPDAAAHLAAVGAHAARHMMAAQGVPVVVKEDRSAVIDAGQIDGRRRAFQHLDAPPALIGLVGGEGHVDDQVVAFLELRGAGGGKA